MGPVAVVSYKYRIGFLSIENTNKYLLLKIRPARPAGPGAGAALALPLALPVRYTLERSERRDARPRESRCI